MSKTPALFPPSLQSTSGSAQVGLLQQGVRLLRSPAVPQASSDVFTFPQSACSLEQNFAVEDVGTPKVGPILGKKKKQAKDSGTWVSFGCVFVPCPHICSHIRLFSFECCSYDGHYQLAQVCPEK